MERPTNGNVKTVVIIVLGCLTAISWGYRAGSAMPEVAEKERTKMEIRIQAVEVKQQAKDVYDAAFQAEVRLKLEQIATDLKEVKAGVRAGY